MSEEAAEKMATRPGDDIMSSSPLRCDEAVHELYHFLDGELTDEKRAQITMHLDQCRPCDAAAHFEAELRRVIADRCSDRVPPSLIERVAAAINEAERHDD
jgi:mycothiol system anti-sigma-R factor